MPLGDKTAELRTKDKQHLKSKVWAISREWLGQRQVWVDRTSQKAQFNQRSKCRLVSNIQRCRSYHSRKKMPSAGAVPSLPVPRVNTKENRWCEWLKGIRKYGRSLWCRGDLELALQRATVKTRATGSNKEEQKQWHRKGQSHPCPYTTTQETMCLE